MKKKYSVLVSLAAFLIIFFQNCGKPPSVENTETAQSNPRLNKYEIGSFKTLSLWDFLQSRFLDLNLQTGEITAFEQGGQVQGDSFQLPPEKMNELRLILSNAEICEPLEDDKASEDMMCTMVYTYPYATLVSQEDQVKLGEKVSGCDKPVDLCGVKAQQLKDWAQSVVEGL